jgi:hypothetical protein
MSDMRKEHNTMPASSGRRSWVTRSLAALLVAFAAAMVCSTAARAEEYGILPGSFTADSLRADGTTPETQAGVRPFQATTRFQFRYGDPAETMISGFTRDIDVKLPRGFIGNPEAAAKCPRADFDGILSKTSVCPPSSQVGVVTITMLFRNNEIRIATYPVYNLEPMPGQTADFGAPFSIVPVHITATVDTAGDYQLKAEVRRLSQGVPLLASELTLWGVPGDNAHDALRACDGDDRIGFKVCNLLPFRYDKRPFLTNPTECGGPTTSSIAVDSWENPGVWSTAEYTPRDPVRGCDRLVFEPSVRVVSGSQRARTSAGYTVDINIPQNDDPYGLGTPPLRDVQMTFPEGTSINPSSADGLEGCTDGQIALRSDAEPTCPDASRIGTVAVRTPLLPRPMEGDVFLGQPLPGNMFRMFLTLRGPGLLIKIPGSIRPDHGTGRVTAIFEDNPPLPFSNLRLELKGGPRAPLSNPSQCGTATTTASLTAWGVDAPAQVSSSFEITQKSDGSPCGPKGFNPTLRAGSVNAAGGASSTFSLMFGRGDDDQTLRNISLQMPEGLTGVLAAVNPCADALAAAGACGEDSRIGSVVSGAGAGSAPLYLPGRVYLTGPYKGAPLGLSIVVPAIAGPFDLGTVAVRSALFVDKNNTSLRVVSDDIPSILEGVPLQVRSVNVKIDKPGFMVNPTNCMPKTLSGVINAIEGASAARSTRYQVGNCASLPFKPRMALKIGSRGRTRPGITVPFQTVVNMTPGQSNIRSVRVNLPRNINARLPVINRNACPLPDYEAGKCPVSLAVGNAVATTPLLKDPLRGLAYFVRNPARRIPDLVVALKGQVAVDLTGKVSIPRDLTLATTFDTVPDVPITRFTLNLVAGRSGPIGTIGNLCSARVRRGMSAKLDFRGQNGKRISRSQKMSIAGCTRTIRARARRGRARGGRRASRRGTR